VERLDDALGELAGHVVDHDEVALHRRATPGAELERPWPRGAEQLVEGLGERGHALVLEDRATSSRSTPTSAEAVEGGAGGVGVGVDVRATVPWSRKAARVASGMVFTVSGR
jgi:hypothetical protein